MSIHPYVLEMKKLLHSLDGWLDKTTAYATAKKFDANTLLQARLAPDMFPLIKQIQATCDQAKFGASRTAGKETPSHADTETTIEEARKRVTTVIAYLDTFKKEDFDGAEKRSITTPRWEGKTMSGLDYFVEHAQANFYFHLMTTYLILRHNGVDLGKRDYLGSLSLR